MEDRLVYWSSLGFTKICVIVFFFLYLSKTSTNRKSLEYMDKYKSKDDFHKGSLQPHFLTKTKKEKKKKEKKTLKMFIKCVHILIFNMFGPINSYSRDKVVLSLEIRVQVLDLPCLAHIKVFLISKKKKM